MKTIEQLKPCPYCGGRAYVNTTLRPTGYIELKRNVYIDCEHDKNCKTRPNTWLESNESLLKQAEMWNERSSLIFGPSEDGGE